MSRGIAPTDICHRATADSTEAQRPSRWLRRGNGDRITRIPSPASSECGTRDVKPSAESSVKREGRARSMGSALDVDAQPESRSSTEAKAVAPAAIIARRRPATLRSRAKQGRTRRLRQHDAVELAQFVSGGRAASVTPINHVMSHCPSSNPEDPVSVAAFAAGAECRDAERFIVLATLVHDRFAPRRLPERKWANLEAILLVRLSI